MTPTTSAGDLHVRFPPDVYEKLRRAAFEQHTSMNALVVAAVVAALPVPGQREAS